MTETKYFPIEIRHHAEKSIILSELSQEKIPEAIRKDSFFTHLLLGTSGVGNSRVVPTEGVCLIIEKNPRTIQWAEIAKEYKISFIFLEDIWEDIQEECPHCKGRGRILKI